MILTATQAKRKRQLTLAIRNTAANALTEYVFYGCEAEIEDVKDMMFYIHENVLSEEQALQFAKDAGHVVSKIEIKVVDDHKK